MFREENKTKYGNYSVGANNDGPRGPIQIGRGLTVELDEIQNLGPFTQSGGSQGGNTSTPPVPNRISKEKCNKVVSILMF